MRYRFLLGCLILSGFAGLAYELLWVRLLALSFGSTAASFSTVLAVFFGGLAIGSLIGGRLARRVTRPVRAYAIIELIAGAVAVGLYPILVGLESAFAQYDPGTGPLGIIVRVLVASVVLLPPTVLMGATIPFVTRAMVDRDEDVGRATALIYAFNTFGACLGAYVTTFWSLPVLGVSGATFATAGLNLAVFAIAIGLGRGEQALAVTPPPTSRAETDGDGKLKLMGTLVAGMLGYAAVALQVVWVRVFAVAMQGTVYGTGSVLIAVLVGIGAGSLLLASVLKRSPRAGLAFVGLQVAGLGLVLLTFRLLPWISYELGALQIAKLGTIGLHLQMVIVIMTVLGPSVCSGASLPLIVGIVEAKAVNSARTVGNVYAANTIGAILGSLVTGFLVLPAAGSEAAVLLAVIALGGAAAFGALFLTEVARPLRLAMVPAGLALAALYDGYDVQALATSPRPGSYFDWWKATQSQRRMTILFSEAQSANVLVVDTPRTRSLSLSGLGQGGRRKQPPHLIRESLLVAMIPLVHATQTERALLVGLGAGVTVDAMTKLGIGQVRVVELEPKVVDAVEAIFQQDNPLASDRVEVIINDARHVLNAQRGEDGGYDIIASMPAHPWVASPIFTREFFAIAKANLRPQGVFCSWFGLGRMNELTTDSLVRAFTSVFDHYIVYYLPRNGAYFLVGSPSPLVVDPERYLAMSQQPIVRAHEALADPLFLPQRIQASGRDATPLKPGPVNTDDHPIVEMMSPTTTATKATASADLFPKRGLDPRMVPESERSTFLVRLIEAHLGTPDGRLPLKTRRGNLSAAADLIERVQGVVTASVARYLDVRLAIARNPTPAGLPDRVEALASADDRARARRAYAWSLPPDTAARARALAALPAETAVIFHQLRESGLDALARVPPTPVAVAEDPMGWWLWSLAHGGRLDESDRRHLVERVGPMLAVSVNEPLLRATSTRLRSAGEGRLARAVDAWADKARHARATYHRRKGIDAGKAHRYQDAATHLWTAFSATPSDEKLYPPLAHSLVAIKDEARLASFADALRFVGTSPERIAFIVRDARRKVAASGKSGAETASRSAQGSTSTPSARP